MNISANTNSNIKLTIVKYEPAIIHICVFKKFLYPIRINN